MNENDPAKARFFVLQAMRWSGLAMVLAGIAIIMGKINLPIEAGYVLLVVGVADALFVPIMLARAWKTPLP